MIAVQYQTTAGAPIRSFGQRQLLSVAASTARLTGVRRVDCDESTTGTFRLVRQIRAELRPRRVRDTFRETMVVDHPVHGQVFDCDHLKAVHQFPAVLMREVLAPVGNALMDMSNCPSALPAGRTPFGLRAQALLNVGQVGLIPAEESCKRLQVRCS